MGQHLLGQDLAELHALLVEAVDVPHESLIHDLILEVGQERSQGLGGQLLSRDDAGGTSARKVLVAVLVRLAAGENPTASP
mgnify:CR=1 FL=1